MAGRLVRTNGGAGVGPRALRLPSRCMARRSVAAVAVSRCGGADRGVRAVLAWAGTEMQHWLGGQADTAPPHHSSYTSKSNSYHGEPFIPADVFSVSWQQARLDTGQRAGGVCMQHDGYK